MPPVPEAEARLLEERQLTKGAARQGLALTAEHYFTSTDRSICRFDTQWKLLEEKGIRIDGVNHLGAIHHHDGFLWVGLLNGPDDGDRLVRDGVLRYPKPMHFSQGIRIIGRKLYSIHTFGEMKGLFEFDLPETLTVAIQQPTRVWKIQETTMHLEGFDFIPGRPNEIWHAQGRQVDRYELNLSNP